MKGFKLLFVIDNQTIYFFQTVKSSNPNQIDCLTCKYFSLKCLLKTRGGDPQVAGMENCSCILYKIEEQEQNYYSLLPIVAYSILLL